MNFSSICSRNRFVISTGKKSHKKATQSLNMRIAEHQKKIRLENKKDFPNEGLIRHWESEIRAFEQGIQQALQRLGNNMKIQNRTLPIASSTLSTLTMELGTKCQNVTALIHQLQSPHLSAR